MSKRVRAGRGRASGVADDRIGAPAGERAYPKDRARMMGRARRHHDTYGQFFDLENFTSLAHWMTER
jgi:hypothetical protein